MHIHSYKYYLSALEKKPKFSLLQKTSFLIFSLVFALGGALSAFSLWQYYKEEPLRVQNRYLESAISGFSESKNSLSEVITTFQIAGARTKAVTSRQESTPSAQGYFISLDDITNAMTTVQNTQKSLLFDKNQLSKLPPIQKFQQIRNELLAFYNQSANLLDNLSREQQFQKEILIASGTSFYSPALSNDTLWRAQKPEPLINYYNGKKREALIAIADLSHLDVPDDFKTYYDTQVAYLELASTTSDDIVKTLSLPDDTAKDSVPQLEKAYQILQVASVKNKDLTDKLLSEKLKVFDKKRNLEKFANVNISQNSLENKLSQLYLDQPQPKTYHLPEILIKVLNRVRSAVSAIT